jgi:hypothetical protein
MFSLVSWQALLIGFGIVITFILAYSFCRYVTKQKSPVLVYEACPHPNPPLPALSPIPTHPEKVLDWYKKHVYWDPTVPKPERIELLHQYNVNKKKTRRANGKNTHTLTPQPVRFWQLTRFPQH